MSDQTPAQQLVAIKARRDETIAALCEHFANDRLTLEEFEKRLDIANRALTVPELDTLLADIAVQVPATALASAASAPLAHASEAQTMIAIMGGVERRGHWSPAAHTRVVAIMGGAVLDFREVQLPPGQTRVTIVAIMGGAEIIVPPTMNVDVEGIAFMGGFTQSHTRPAGAPPGAPVLRIDGFAMMGGVDVQVRELGEKAPSPGSQMRDIRAQLREERRRLRDQIRGRN